MNNTLYKMYTRRIWLGLLCASLIFALLNGCNSNPVKGADSLRANAKAYGKLIRWKGYEDASKYIRLRDGGEIVMDLKLLGEIRVTKYEISSMVLNDDNDEAVVSADISYYHERVNHVHNIRDQQIWWKEENTGNWYLDGQLPPFVR